MRTLITTLDDWKEVQRENWGLPFAFDFETTGLSFRKNDVCGLAITFSNSKSYYLCFMHTLPQEEWVKETYTEQVLVGYEEEVYFTPKKQLRKTKQVPVYEDVVKTRMVEKTTYPIHQYVDPKEASVLLNYLFDQDVEVMVAHNEKFDLHFLQEKTNIVLTKKDADTMLAAKLVDENRLVGLKQLAPLVYMELTDYASLPHYPGFSKEEFLGVPLDLGSNYAMMDTECTWKLWRLFEPELEFEGVAQAFWKIWMPNMRTLQKMEHRGISIDLEKVQILKDKYEAERADADKRIMEMGLKMVNEAFNPTNVPLNYMRMLTADETSRYEACDALSATIITDEGYNTLAFKPTPRSAPRALTFNPASNDHLSKLFYDYLGLTVPKGLKMGKTNDGRPVDKNMLKIWQNSLGDECPKIISDIITRREAEKFITTYLDRMLSDADRSNYNCIHTSFNQHIADTGRLTASNPNLQNIPSRGARGKEARDLFIARPNHNLIVADYSSMELVLASHYTAKWLHEKGENTDHTMLTAIRDGLDLHALTASTQFDVDYQKLLDAVENGDVDAKLKRMIGKTSNFGLLYGMGAGKFQVYLWTEVGVYYPLNKVKGLIEAFESTYQEVTDWKFHEIAELHKYGYVETIGKRKRRLDQVHSADRYERTRAERQGVNAKIQGSCADIIQAAMPNIQKELEAIDGSLLLQVHDELVGEVHRRDTKEGIDIIQRGMTQHINHKLMLPLVATAHAGSSWGTAKQS